VPPASKGTYFVNTAFGVQQERAGRPVKFRKIVCSGYINLTGASSCGGCTKLIYEPVERATASEEATDTMVTAAPGATRNPLRVLIVDDNEDISDSTAILLTYAGHEVRTAGNGLQALDMALDFQPAVVLLDIGLPDMDGFEVARRLRRIDKLATMRLIAVSGYDTPEAHSRSVEAVFDYHVGKPVDIAALEVLMAT
jgi:two-component system CheB/CheR fusion protein